MPEILIVEDERALQETLAYNLERQGFRVRCAADGWEAVQSVQAAPPDLIILDLMLPGMDGFAVCRALRPAYKMPVLMLTARDAEQDRVRGLEVGADDYLTKPFSMQELIARVKALLRRVAMDTNQEARFSTKHLVSGNLVIDADRHEVRLDGKPLALKPREYDLLLYLVQHRGQALSREQILRQVWGWDYTGNSRTVDVHVRWLREKIESNPREPKRIITIRGAGYRFDE
ncbi:MAG: DNA-binding response regulator [Anaerolineae bacterium]|nr:MAG: DNA-binding response regulator [Anaerolineae bacterium]